MDFFKLAAVAALTTSLAAPQLMAQTTQTPSTQTPRTAPGPTAPGTAPSTRPGTGTTQPPSSQSQPGSAQSSLVDINSASAEQLDNLPGIGQARAKAIIDHRPYRSKDELVSKKVIPQNAYEAIKDKIIARQAAR